MIFGTIVLQQGILIQKTIWKKRLLFHAFAFRLGHEYFSVDLKPGVIGPTITHIYVFYWNDTIRECVICPWTPDGDIKQPNLHGIQNYSILLEIYTYSAVFCWARFQLILPICFRVTQQSFLSSPYCQIINLKMCLIKSQESITRWW